MRNVTARSRAEAGHAARLVPHSPGPIAAQPALTYNWESSPASTTYPIDLSNPGSATSQLRSPPGPTVLVVEDEDGLRQAIRRILQDQGYRVLDAPHGAAALALVNGAEAGRIDLVLTDLRMPVMDGRALAAALARTHPELPIVFMSGFTAQLMDLRMVSPHLAFLAKPFGNDELLATVRGRLGDRS
ncbi:MAG: response regulator [Gemmatimonadales bacterium]